MVIDALDYVVTVPKSFKHPDHPGLVGLAAWCAEGDSAGEPETGQDWWFTTYGNISRLVRCVPGTSRLYIVCNELVRGYSVITDVRYDDSRVRNGSAPVAILPTPRGALHPCSKLTPEAVRAIRAEYEYAPRTRSGSVLPGFAARLARRYGVTVPCVSRVAKQLDWKGV